MELAGFDIQAMITAAQTWLTGMVQPWRLLQIAMLLALFGLAHIISRKLLDDRIDHWMRSLQNMRPIQLRMLLVVARRMRGLVFVVLAWSTVLIMRDVTWFSRSSLIALVATLVSAWLFVAIATRLVKNNLLRNVLRYGAWAYATLAILGLDDGAMDVLRSAEFGIGSINVSLLAILQSILVFFALFFAARWFSHFIHRRLMVVEDLSPSMRVLAEKLLTLGAYTLAVVFSIRSLGFDLTSLAVLSGAIGVGIGFGLQKVVSNLVSGFILLLDKSIKPGDVISLGDTFGWIETLGARYVSVITRDGREYLIPNEDLITGQVVNWSHSSDLVRLDISFGVAYHSDPHEVRRIAVAAAQSVPRVVSDPASVCHIVGFGDSSIDLTLRFWIKDPSGGLTNVRGAVFLALWDALKEHHIDIPFPRRDVQILPGSAGPPAPDPQA